MSAKNFEAEDLIMTFILLLIVKHLFNELLKFEDLKCDDRPWLWA